MLEFLAYAVNYSGNARASLGFTAKCACVNEFRGGTQDNLIFETVYGGGLYTHRLTAYSQRHVKPGRAELGVALQPAVRTGVRRWATGPGESSARMLKRMSERRIAQDQRGSVSHLEVQEYHLGWHPRPMTGMDAVFEIMYSICYFISPIHYFTFEGPTILG